MGAARDRRDGHKYVVKTLALGAAAARDRAAALQEAQLLARLKHPNIVAYHESFAVDAGARLCIAMAYCEGGDLHARLRAQHGALLPQRQVVEWFVQIALALQYLHANKILHRDLKTQNIFLRRGMIKVGDLGIARQLHNDQDMATTVRGRAPSHLAPPRPCPPARYAHE